MVKLKGLIDLSETGCMKPGCKHKYTVPNRHHTRHEKTWLNQWERMGPPTFRGERDLGRRMMLLLKERYHQFRPQDTVRICEWHHAEIHDIYRTIIRRVETSFGRKREAFSFEQAFFAMHECRKFCLEWLDKETPGYNPGRARRVGKW